MDDIGYNGYRYGGGRVDYTPVYTGGQAGYTPTPYTGGQAGYTPTPTPVYTGGQAVYTPAYDGVYAAPAGQYYGTGLLGGDAGEGAGAGEEKKECKCVKSLTVNKNTVVGTTTVGSLTATNWPSYPFWAEQRGDNATMWPLVKIVGTTPGSVTLTYDDLKTRADGKVASDGTATFTFAPGSAISGTDLRGTFNIGTQVLTVGDRAYVPLVQDAKCAPSPECKTSEQMGTWTFPTKNGWFWVIVAGLFVFSLLMFGIGRGTASCPQTVITQSKP